MTDSLWLIVATLSMFLSMSWLALSLKSHWQQVFPAQNNKPHKTRLRISGAIFLLLSIVSCLQADHPSMAVLVWLMLLPGAAMAVAMTLSKRPTTLQLICPAFNRLNTANIDQ